MHIVIIYSIFKKKSHYLNEINIKGQKLINYIHVASPTLEIYTGTCDDW
jgi:hypothetical protein